MFWNFSQAVVNRVTVFGFFLAVIAFAVSIYFSVYGEPAAQSDANQPQEIVIANPGESSSKQTYHHCRLDELSEKEKATGYYECQDPPLTNAVPGMPVYSLPITPN